MARHDWALCEVGVYRLICATEPLFYWGTGKARQLYSLSLHGTARWRYGLLVWNSAGERSAAGCGSVRGSGSGTICTHDALCEGMIP